MTTLPALEVHGLVKTYRKVRALRGVDLSVAEGEIFGFLGPNGAGKTTFIRCLLDLIRPSSGRVTVLGLDARRDSAAIRAQCGYLPGELRLDNRLRVGEILEFLGRLRKSKPDKAFVNSLAERLELDLRLPVKNLSKGNKQKVGVVQALMHRPRLLLLDEPTGGLDPLVQQQVLQLVREARTAGATVFFSSHVLSEVEDVADRVGIVRKGELVECAPTGTLLERALTKVQVRLHSPHDGAFVSALGGVKLLPQTDARTLQFEVRGDMDGLIKALAALPVRDLTAEKPSLEEIFLAYYQEAAP